MGHVLLHVDHTQLPQHSQPVAQGPDLCDLPVGVQSNVLDVLECYLLPGRGIPPRQLPGVSSTDTVGREDQACKVVEMILNSTVSVTETSTTRAPTFTYR